MSNFTNYRINNSFYSTASPTHSRLSADSLSTHSSPLNHKDDWNLRELQAKMRKGVRKEVSAASMSEQLKVFFTMQKGVAIKKLILLLGLTLPLCYIASIEGAVVFTFLILIATELFCSTILPFTDLNLISNVRKLQPIIYCSIFYSFLKWSANIKRQEIDWPLTFIAIVATLVHWTLNFYKPVLQIMTRKIKSQAIRQKSITSKLCVFPRYLMERLRTSLKITRHLIIVVGILCGLAVLLLIFFNKFVMGFFQPRFIFYSFPLFIVLEGYFSILDFVNLAFSLDIRLCKVIKDKIPVFLNLLRLQANSFNRLVQLECAKCVLLKIQDAEDFLANETCKSLVYSTYMDIFNQFAGIQLEKSDKQMQELLTKIKINDKVVSERKGLLEDLLIYFKKFIAVVQSEWYASQYLELLARLNFLFLIIDKIEARRNDEEPVISRRVLSLTNTIKQGVKECAERVSLSSYTQGELASCHQSFTVELAEL